MGKDFTGEAVAFEEEINRSSTDDNDQSEIDVDMDDDLKIEDLLAGTGVVIEETNNAAEIFKEDVEELLNQKDKKKFKKRDFFNEIPETETAEKFNKILKRKQQDNEKLFQKKLKMEFDAKMARLNRIKSKSHKKAVRKEKTKLSAALYEEMSMSSESNESEGSEIINEFELNPVAAFKPNPEDLINKEPEMKMNSNANLIDEMFNERDDSFEKEKADIIDEDAPKIITDVLPGFDGEWAGDGIETIMNDKNTVKSSIKGIGAAKRSDFGISHVIINENIAYDEKYKSQLPFGYTEKMYKQKLQMRPSQVKRTVGELAGEDVTQKKLREE